MGSLQRTCAIQFGIGDESNILLTKVWDWAFEVRPSQPNTARWHNFDKNIQTNKEKSMTCIEHSHIIEIFLVGLLYNKKQR